MLLCLCGAGTAWAGDVWGPRSPQLPARPQRIVVLEYMFAESLAALGITPVGMADPERYRTWVGVDNARFVDMPDVGTRQQPSLEAIARLKPDLIIGVSFRHAALLGALQRIAPTVLLHYYASDVKVNQLTHVMQVLDAVAALVGRVPEGRQVRRDVQLALAADRARLAAAGLLGQRVAVLQELGLQDMYWAHTANSMAAGVAQQLDLRYWPDWPTPEGTDYVNSEALLGVSDVSIQLISMTGPEVRLEQKLNSPIWRFVPARSAGRVGVLPRNIWGFSGPLSAVQLSHAMTQLVLHTANPLAYGAP